jgi:hypothetical protein
LVHIWCPARVHLRQFLDPGIPKLHARPVAEKSDMARTCARGPDASPVLWARGLCRDWRRE